MEAMIIFLILLTILFWVFVFWLIFSGFVKQRKATDEATKNSGQLRMIVGVIILVIGGSFCGLVIKLLN